jgi:hypothetical protein
MSDSEVEVAQMMFELAELEDLPNHSPVIGDFDMFE